jgi:thiol-disulfide isomerase/thioredoxin
MKNLIAAVCIVFCYCAQAQGIRFESAAWNEIREKAAKENKLIFVDAYTSWCGPCKTMAKNTFTQKSVGEFYNANFINVKMDMENGEGPSLAKLYDVLCYPNLLFINADGKLVHRSAGFMKPDDFIELGKNAMIPAQTFVSLQDKYASGNYDPAFLTGYLKYLSNSCLPVGDAAVKHLEKQDESLLTSKHNWDILNEHVTDVHSKPFKYFLQNRGRYISVYGDSVVNNKIFNSFLDAATVQMYSKNADSSLMMLRHTIGRLKFAREEELMLTIDANAGLHKKDWPRYFSASGILIDKFRGADSDFLNNVSWTIFENSNDKAHLEAAEAWAKRSVELKEASANLDTYACLMNKNGKKKQAIEVEKKAIALAKANGEETADLEKTLKGFESNR